jgi:hypothetical protein
MINTMSFGRRAQRGPRPRGVWILTICAAIFAGVYPILGSLFVFAAREQLDTPGTVPIALLSTALGASIIAAAIAAWRGSNTGSWVLLGLVVAFYVLLAWSNYTTATAPLIPDDIRRDYMTVAIRSLLWIPIYLWYFLRAPTRKWYTQEA